MSAEPTTTVVVPMPHMGVSVEEGTVFEWLVAVGDEVKAEDVLCSIATDKVDTEVVAPADGVVARLLVEVDGDVAVGAPLAELAVGADAAVTVAASEPATPAEAKAVPEAPPAPTATLTAEADPDMGLTARAAAGRDEFGRFDPKKAAESVVSFVANGGGATGTAVPASPIAKRMAANHGVDLGAVKGSGRRGRIRKADVERALASTGSPADGPKSQRIGDKSAHRQPDLGADGLPTGYGDVPHEVVKTTRVRRAIAEHMARSRQTAAHMTTEVDVDLDAVVRARTELNAARLAGGESKLSYLPFIARAACAALGEHPDLNATFLGERMIRWQEVNLGVAVDTPEGLLVPIVKGCEKLTAPAIGEAIADLAARARSRKLVPDDLAGGTFTLSNPGSVGAVSAPAIINQPQVAILGVPTIQRRPWVVADERGGESIAIRSILRLAVTFDHRAVDGASATRFAVAVKDHLEAWGPEAYA